MSPSPWSADRRRPDDPPPELIEILVAQALDDIDQYRLSSEQALRTIAVTAWRMARAQQTSAEG